MGIIISEEHTGRELEIDLNSVPEAIHHQELITKGAVANYQGPLGTVFYRDGEEIPGTPITYTDLKDLDEDTREELARIEAEARKLMERAKGLLKGVLRPAFEAKVSAA